MPEPYEFHDYVCPDIDPDDLWNDDDLYEDLPALTTPAAPPDFFRWVFDGDERFAAFHASEGYHADLYARFGVGGWGNEFALGVFELDDRRVELRFYADVERPAVDREALRAHITAFLEGRGPAANGSYSRHLRSFVWAAGHLELEHGGERVSHVELERRLRTRVPEATAPSVHGEVWQRGQRRHATHTPTTDPDALRAALGSALPGPAIEFEQIAESR
jgi:hypothetical protein